jgi:hypothetical protein
MTRWCWSVMGTADAHGSPRGFSASGVIEAEGGEEALLILLGEIPGPWDELDSDQGFSVLITPDGTS